MARSRSVDDLMAEYRQLAKRADQRMVRLERYSQTEKYKGVLKFAYRRAQHELKQWNSPERVASGKPLRFNTAPPRTKTGKVNVKSLEAKINTIKRFLSSQSSTVKKPKEPFAGEKGIDEVYQKRVKTLNKKWKTDFDWESLAKFFDSGLADKLSEYGSDIRLRLVAVVQANREQVKKSIESGEKHLVTDVNPFDRRRKKLDTFMQTKVDDIIKDYGTELKDFLEG